MNSFDAQGDDSGLNAFHFTSACIQRRVDDLQTPRRKGLVLRYEAHNFMQVLRVERLVKITEKGHQHGWQRGQFTRIAKFLQDWIFGRHRYFPSFTSRFSALT